MLLDSRYCNVDIDCIGVMHINVIMVCVCVCEYQWASE